MAHFVLHPIQTKKAVPPGEPPPLGVSRQAHPARYSVNRLRLHLCGPACGTVVRQSGSRRSHAAFSTEDGTISGWSPAVDRTHAIRTVDNFGGGHGAVYKGLALATNSAGQQQLFATNFRSGRVDVFDSSFKPGHNRFPLFDPFLPDGFAPLRT